MKAFQSFNKRFRKKNLIFTYQNKIAESGAIGIDKVDHFNFSQNLTENIEIIKRKVENDSYKFTVYKQKLISKGAESKPRAISIPTIRDRLTLRCLCDILFDVYKDEIKLNIPQISIHKIQSEIQKNSYDAYVKMDIRSFYGSIPHEQLMNSIKNKIRKKEMIHLINKAITNGTTLSPRKGEVYKNDNGIPQGLSISNILAEIFMSDFDKAISANENLAYYRYVDDILILCNYQNAQDIGNMIIDKLLEKGLTAHPLEENSKSEFGYLSNQFSFLGYFFENYQTSVGIGTEYRFETSIVRLLTTYKYRSKFAKELNDEKRNLEILEWRINLRITGCIFNNTKRGWIFYYSQITDLKVLYKLDSTIKSLIKRFNLEGKLKIKKLSKSYFEAKKIDVSNNQYIINFDTLTKEEKIDILHKYLGTKKYSLTNKTEEEIDRLFNTRIGQVIKELEEDLQDFS